MRADQVTKMLREIEQRPNQRALDVLRTWCAEDGISLESYRLRIEALEKKIAVSEVMES